MPQKWPDISFFFLQFFRFFNYIYMCNQHYFDNICTQPKIQTYIESLFSKYCNFFSLVFHLRTMMIHRIVGKRGNHLVLLYHFQPFINIQTFINIYLQFCVIVLLSAAYIIVMLLLNEIYKFSNVFKFTPTIILKLQARWLTKWACNSAFKSKKEANLDNSKVFN